MSHLLNRPSPLCRLLLIAGGVSSLALGVFAIVVRTQPGLARSSRGWCLGCGWSDTAAFPGSPGRRPAVATLQHPPSRTLCLHAQVAPLLPPSTRPWLAALQADRYYRLLVPVTLPVTIAFVALNWFSLKLFKHNS